LPGCDIIRRSLFAPIAEELEKRYFKYAVGPCKKKVYIEFIRAKAQVIESALNMNKVVNEYTADEMQSHTGLLAACNECDFAAMFETLEVIESMSQPLGDKR